MPPPKEPLAWSGDFSYAYFRRILELARSRFELRRMGECPSARAARPILYLRHDVDVSLERALDMAEVESKSAVQATYMVAVDSPLYAPSRTLLEEIRARGHEIGLHARVGPGVPEEGTLGESRRRLEDVLGARVRSVSFHQPTAQQLRGPRTVGGMVNAYGKELMRRYLSDSAGRWREGDPLAALARPRPGPTQLLFHPIYWGARHLDPADRLEDYFRSQTSGRERRFAIRFDAELAAAVRPAMRRGRSRG